MGRYGLSVICQSAGRKVVRPAGFEPATYGSGGRRSIQLSYGRVKELTRLGYDTYRLLTPRRSARGGRLDCIGLHPCPRQRVVDVDGRIPHRPKIIGAVSG